MTAKPLVIDRHAAGRLKERHITRQMVRETMAVGEPFAVDPAQGVRRIGRQLKYGNRTLIAIWIEDAETMELITAMWKA